MTGETNAPTRRLAHSVRLRNTLLKPGCGLKFKPARDAAATPEFACSCQPIEVQRQGSRPPPWRQLPQTEA